MFKSLSFFCKGKHDFLSQKYSLDKILDSKGLKKLLSFATALIVYKQHAYFNCRSRRTNGSKGWQLLTLVNSFVLMKNVTTKFINTSHAFSGFLLLRYFCISVKFIYPLTNMRRWNSDKILFNLEYRRDALSRSVTCVIIFISMAHTTVQFALVNSHNFMTN